MVNTRSVKLDSLSNTGNICTGHVRSIDQSINQSVSQSINTTTNKTTKKKSIPSTPVDKPVNPTFIWITMGCGRRPLLFTLQSLGFITRRCGLEVASWKITAVFSGYIYSILSFPSLWWYSTASTAVLNSTAEEAQLGLWNTAVAGKNFLTGISRIRAVCV